MMLDNFFLYNISLYEIIIFLNELQILMDKKD